ncbi:MAG: NifU family protein [Kiritimatiellia bacterium]|jgi:Fe-S cluster biogenesis protein NfuA
MEEKIKSLLEDLRKMLQDDGGDLELVSIEGNTIKLRLKGACGCCPHAMSTLKNGIERVLREQISPDLTVERAQ